MEHKIGIVVLAAGNSSRLGLPKQLLEYKNTTLLKKIIKEALLLPRCAIIVVTGAYNELIEKELDKTVLTICFNPDWKSGMASSIVKGLEAVLQLHPDIEKCLFTVCDQPYVTDAVFKNLVSEQDKTNKGIVACAYSETLGTPVLFDKKHFSALLALKGQEGAKKIINAYLDDTVSIPFEKGAIDIDTAEDYQNLIN